MSRTKTLEKINNLHYRVSVGTISNKEYITIKSTYYTNDYYDAIYQARKWYEENKKSYESRGRNPIALVHKFTKINKRANMEYGKCIACFSSRELV